MQTITANAITLPQSLDAALEYIRSARRAGLITIPDIHKTNSEIAALAELDPTIHPKAAKSAVIIASIKAAGGIVDLHSLTVSWPT